MKRKKGSKAGDKRGKKKKLTVVADNPASNLNSETTDDNWGSDEIDDGGIDSTLEPEVPSSRSHKTNQYINADIQRFGDRPVIPTGHGRVKVKLKSSKVLEPRVTGSDTQTQSDTDRSSQQVVSEKLGEVVEKMELGHTSLSHIVPGQPSRKVASVKIKTSRGLGSQMQGDKVHRLLDNENMEDSSERELEMPHYGRRRNEKELNTALGVIKKIMKMDAAEPFNVPVNPIALGIPDYFDIIDTPMDFGTICSNLERGIKYMRSEDVFKDVQIIWDNCHRYNNKGDYIMDLMKRVKKNFTKYWMAAGLQCEAPNRISISGGSASLQINTSAPSSKEKLPSKGGHAKQKKRGRHGIDLHKSDCLCAVCVVRRRKRERCAQMAESQVVTTVDANPSPEFKQEESSPNICNEDGSPNLDSSLGHDAETDMEEQANEFKSGTPDLDSSHMERQDKSESEAEEVEEKPSWDVLHKEASTENIHRESQDQETNMDNVTQHDYQKDESPLASNEAAAHDHTEVGQKQEESMKKHKMQLLDDPVLYENPEVLRLSGILFPSDSKSVWNGPHSLFRRNMSARDSPIHSAIAMFMK